MPTATPLSDSTTSMGFVKPEVGGSRATWGDKLNANWDLLDRILAELEPVGSVKPWLVGNVPHGWLALNGAAVSRATYADLFAVIGTAYGGGDGASTFNLPDWTGRAPAMLDAAGSVLPNASAIGAHLGGAAVTLTEPQMPAHAHAGQTAAAGAHGHDAGSWPAGGHSHLAPFPASTTVGGGPYPVNAAGGSFDAGLRTDGAPDHTHGVSVAAAADHVHPFATDYRGGGQPVSVVQPTVVALWIVRALRAGA